MGRQDIIEHIETEMHRDTAATKEENTRPLLCQHCGQQIGPEADDGLPEHEDYVIHRVPTHGESKMNSVFYCSPDCLDEAMTALFSVSDGGEP